MKGIVLFRKAVLVMAVALLSLASLLALTACDEANKTVIKEGLTDEFEQLKNPDSDLWREAIGSSDGALTERFVSAWSESYSFEIGEITIDGNSATVQVSFTCKQLSPVMKNAEETLLADEGLATLTEDEILKKLEETFLAELDKAQTTTSDILVPCELIDKVWQPSAQAESEIVNALLGSA